MHHHVECDGCGMCPIVGTRFKCAVSEDFDYCEICESTKDHAYPFLQIKTPQQAPRAIMCTMPGQ